MKRKRGSSGRRKPAASKGPADHRAMWEKEAWFCLITGQMPAVLWSTDRDLRFTSSLGGGLSALNLKPNEAVGLTLYDYFRTTDHTFLPIASHLRALKGKQVAFEFEWKGRTWYSVVGPFFNGAHRIVGIVGVAFDITERKQTEELERRRTEPLIRRQKALLELARSKSVDWTDAVRRITEVVARTLGVDRVSVWMFSQDRSEIICEDLYKLPSNSRESGLHLQAKQYPLYFRALEESRTIAADDARTDPRTSEYTDGYLIPLGITSMMDVPVWLHGKVVGIVCHEHIGPARHWSPDEQDFAASAADLLSLALESAERKRAEDALIASEKMSKAYAGELSVVNRDLETLLDIISHDLKEPLRSIENFSQVILERYAVNLEERGRDFFQRMSRASARMRVLLDEIMSLSRARKFELPQKKVSSLILVRVAMKRLEAKIQETGATIRIGGKLPKVIAHPTWAAQAVFNLLDNALKFTCAGRPPEIEVGPYDGPQGSGIAVRDRGPGVSPDHAKRIFDLFQRAVGREVEGTGAGLAIVRQVAERHGGAAWVRPRKGGGSEFMITFGKSEPAGRK